MTAIDLKEQSLAALKDKVVVISGGAQGIGAATVSQLYRYGAKVFHGDWDEAGGQEVNAALLAAPQGSDGTVDFIKTDVTDYSSILTLFDSAYKKHGRVDIAISNAGVIEQGDWFNPALDLESIKEKPTTRTIDVNLTGVMYFSRIAAVYLKQGAQPNEDKSLVLVSSVAGFKESPGLFSYSASKHGVLGLMRALRLYLPKTHGIRTNAICPWMTDTQMVTGIRDNWFKAKLPVNRPEDVGRMMIEVGVCSKWNGRAVFVEGGRGWDIEEGIDGTDGIWMGEELAKTFATGQVILGDGTDWSKR